MTLKQTISVGLYITAAAVFVGSLTTTRPNLRAASPVSADQAGAAAGRLPFTSSFEEITRNKKGEVKIKSYQTIAIRGDGARLLKLGLNDGSRTIVTPSGLRITAFGQRKSTVKVSAPFRRLPTSLCAAPLDEEAIGERMVFGYRAIGKRQRVSDRTRESWYALDYDCALLENTLNFDTGERSVLQLTAFIEGEPDGRLFATENLTEGPPSLLEDDPAAPTDCDAACQASQEKMHKLMDARYQSNRQRHGLTK